MVYVKSVTWARTLANPGESAIQAVSKPVQGEESNSSQQPQPVCPSQGIAEPSHQLCQEGERGQMIGVDLGGNPFRHPDEEAFLPCCQHALLETLGFMEGQLPGRGATLCSHVHSS